MFEDGSAQVVTCTMCQFAFCANCEFPKHTPALCSHMKSWERRGGYIETTDEMKNTRYVRPAHCLLRTGRLMIVPVSASSAV